MTTKTEDLSSSVRNSLEKATPLPKKKVKFVLAE